MAYALVKATIIPEIIRLIVEEYAVNEEKAGEEQGWLSAEDQ
jgi:hypothetical protein